MLQPHNIRPHTSAQSPQNAVTILKRQAATLALLACTCLLVIATSQTPRGATLGSITTEKSQQTYAGYISKEERMTEYLFEGKEANALWV